MNQSIIERIFPHPPRPRSRLRSPFYDGSSGGGGEGGGGRAAASPSRPIALRDYEDRASTTKATLSSVSSSSSIAVKPPPLSASTLHYEDPFLPVERAAKALQRNIQIYLDAQCERLAAHGGGEDDVSSVTSASPSASPNGSAATASRRPAGLKTIPIRQPPQKKISLRGSRKGLARAMDELVQLKEQELRIIARETRGRERALQQTQTFVGKKASLEAKILTMKSEDNTAAPASLRTEAGRVDAEIHELENRLIELRTRHAHLIDQAQQLENALDSKLSSYTSALALVEKDIGQFLRTPPVPSSLASADDPPTSGGGGGGGSGGGGGGMYGLRPDRRTLDMAQEQWAREQSQLGQRKADVEAERGALEQGAQLWRDTVQKIGDYEHQVRQVVKTTNRSSSGSSNHHAEPNKATTSEEDWSRLLTQLDALVAHVSSALATAESRGWNLLICCLGAELEALQQARVLLGGGGGGGGGGSEPNKPSPAVVGGAPHAAAEADDHPPADLHNGNPTASTSTSAGMASGIKGSCNSRSNESLQDTLRAFDVGVVVGGDKGGRGTDHGRQEHVDDDDDDEPGPHFLVSHA